MFTYYTTKFFPLQWDSNQETVESTVECGKGNYGLAK